MHVEIRKRNADEIGKSALYNKGSDDSLNKNGPAQGLSNYLSPELNISRFGEFASA